MWKNCKWTHYLYLEEKKKHDKFDIAHIKNEKKKIKIIRLTSFSLTKSFLFYLINFNNVSCYYYVVYVICYWLTMMMMMDMWIIFFLMLLDSFISQSYTIYGWMDGFEWWIVKKKSKFNPASFSWLCSCWLL